MAFIEFKNVTKVYGEGESQTKAVDGVSFSINQGEFVVLLGPSGAGKSTILNLLGGTDSPTSGSIVVDGLELFGASEPVLTNYRAQKVGFIFQFYNLMPTLTAQENVALMKDIKRSSLNALSALEMVGLGKHAKKFPAQLSGGEQQRVSIARALAKRPALLLADEPTGALDSKTGAQVLQLLLNLTRNQGTTVVIVTHNSSIANVADHVIRIKDAKIFSDEYVENPGTIEDLVW